MPGIAVGTSRQKPEKVDGSKAAVLAARPAVVPTALRGGRLALDPTVAPDLPEGVNRE